MRRRRPNGLMRGCLPPESVVDRAHGTGVCRVRTHPNARRLFGPRLPTLLRLAVLLLGVSLGRCEYADNSADESAAFEISEDAYSVKTQFGSAAPAELNIEVEREKEPH